MKKLVIISHTPHQYHPTKGIVGWSSTVREINFLADYWDEVLHVACLESKQPTGNSAPYNKQNIKLIPIPAFGGKRWWQKLDILYKSPKILLIVHRALKNASDVQIRLPMGIGLVLLLYFKFKKRLGLNLWVKYATNWNEPSHSRSYRWQRFLLNLNWLKCTVTINGRWPKQPPHCKTFENPCLTEKELHAGEQLANTKSIAPPYTFIFIGRVDASKGADLLIESASAWPTEKISKIHIIGEGPMEEALKTRLISLNITAKFHGFTTQEKTFKLLSESHFLILPSKSEGFPKVVSECMNFGCIPIVTKVGSIPQYIHDGCTGILISSLLPESLSDAIHRATLLEENNHIEMIKRCRRLAQQFTFEEYIKRLKKEIILNAS